MADSKKNRAQLINELEELRLELEALEAAKPTRALGILESESKSRVLLENIPAFITEVDLSGKIITLNKVPAGYSLSDYLGKSIFEATHPDGLEQLKSAFEEVVREGKLVEFEAQGYGDEGTLAWYHRYLMPIIDGDEVQSVMIVLSDITERKTAEEKLKQSEERFRQLADDQTSFIARWLPDGTRKFINKSYSDYLGGSREQLMKMNVFSSVSQEIADEIKKIIQSLTPDNPISIDEQKIIANNGESQWRRWINRGFFDKEGELIEILSEGSDITERKMAEDELKKSEERFRRLVEEQSSFIARWLPDGTRKFLNKSYIEHLGRPVEELMATTPFLTLPEDVVVELKNTIRSLTPENPVSIDEQKKIMPNGETIWRRWVMRGFFDEDGNLLELLSEGLDITDRKRVEEALQESEARYRRLLDDQMSFIVRWRPDGSRIFVNESYCEYLGLTNEELMDTNVYLSIDEEVAIDIKDRIQLLTPENPVSVDEHETIRPDGEIIWRIWSMRGFFDDDGKLIELLSEGSDISESKRANEELKKSEARYRGTLDSMMEGCQIIDFDCRYVYINDTAEIHGRMSREEKLGRTLLEVYPSIEGTELHTALKNCLEERIPYNMENELEFPDGKKGWYELSITPIPEGAFLLSIDITERKLAAQALGESEEKYRNLFETMGQGVVYQAASGEITLANPTAERILGLSLDQMRGLKSTNPRWRAIQEDGSDFPGENHPSMLALEKGEEVRDVIMGVFHPTLDEIRWIAINATPQFREGEEKAFQVYTTFTDITERKRAEEAVRESEEKFRNLFSYAHDSIFISDPDTRQFIDVNENACTRLGYTREELLKLTINDIYSPDAETRNVEIYQELLETGSVVFEHIQRRKDGTNIPVEISSQVIEYNGKKVFQSFVRDITARKEAEQELRKSESALNKAQEVAHVGSWSWHIPTNQLVWSDEMYRIFGIDKENFSGVLSDVMGNAIHPDDRPAVEQSNLSVINDQKLIPLEYRVVWPDRTVRVVWAEAGELTLDEDGKPATLTGIVQDITERKNAEVALRESEALYHGLVEASQDLIWKCDAEGRFTFLNQAWEQTHGYKVEEMLGRPFTDFEPEEIIEQEVQEFERHIQGGEIKGHETIHLSKTGEEIHLVFNAMPLYAEGGEIIGTHGTAHDITNRKNAEVALRNSEARWQILSTATFEGIVMSDKGLVMDANEQMASILGYELNELVGMDVGKFVSKEDIDFVRSKVMGGSEEPYEHRALRKDGTVIFVEVRPRMMDIGDRPVRVTAIRDITERKKAEDTLQVYSERLEEMVDARTRELKAAQEQLILKERLAVLGELAGGVGHELRNPMTGISNAVYYLKTILPDADENVTEYLEIISQEIKNTSKIVSDLLDYGGLRSSDKRQTEIREMITKAIKRNPAPENVKVTTRIATKLPKIVVDASQIGQVLDNLLSNAFQAMPDGGQVKINAALKKDRLHIRISDNGEGIKPENLEKIFEPLFTTKARGIGLGLPLSKRMVEANDGQLNIESKESEGSSFTINLPIREN